MKKLIESKHELFNVCLDEIRKDISNQNEMIRREKAKYGQTIRFKALNKELKNLKLLLKNIKLCYPLSERFWGSRTDPERFCRRYTGKF